MDCGGPMAGDFFLFDSLAAPSPLPPRHSRKGKTNDPSSLFPFFLGAQD